MDFLGIGPLELLFIIVIALIAIGPRDIARTARTAGRFLNRLYRSSEWKSLNQASRALRNLPSRLAREAELEEITRAQKELRAEGEEIQAEMQELEEGMRAWVPKPPDRDAPGPPSSPGPASEGDPEPPGP
jgi:Sec-independent protein translocase protein TatA